MQKRSCVFFSLVTLLLSALSGPAAAQDGYPSAAVRVVLGFAPGALTDVLARTLAQKLSSQMNANFVVENKPGANANIAAQFVVTSKPDGYTLLFNTSSAILSRAFDAKLSYDVFKDLMPVAILASSPLVLFVHPTVPANNVSEFIAHLRANPDKLAFSSAGGGTLTHLGPLLFLQANGLSALHVPYKGVGPALTDFVGGRVQFAMQSLTGMLPLVKDKRIKALAIAAPRRTPLLSDVPTLVETMPGFETVGNWFGVLAPAKTSPAIVKRLNGEILKALQDEDMKGRLAQEGAEPLNLSPDEYGAFMRREMERWAKVIKSAGVTLE